MKNRFDLLVFDWDGTLCDSVAWIVHSIQSAARDCGMAVPDVAKAKSMIGLSTAIAMQQLYGPIDAQKVDDLVEGYRHHYFSKPISEKDLFDGVDHMLREFIGNGFKLAVATGKSSKALERALISTGTGAYFVSVKSAETTASKPDPKMLLEIMDEVGIPADRTLMVGDSVHDLRMAVNAGVDSVGVSCGANSRDELMSLQPLTCLDQTTKLLELLV